MLLLATTIPDTMISDFSDGPKGSTNSREFKLQRQNRQLLEENNLLKYKIELLLDMVRTQLIYIAC